MTIIVDGVIEELVTQGVNSLVRIVSDNVKLVGGINSEIKDLTSDIQMFNARLIEASKNPRANDHQVLRLIVNKFGSVVNEAEDTIADYVVLKKKHGHRALSKSLDKIPFCGKVSGYASEIQSIRTKMNAIRQEHEQELQHLMQYEIKDEDKALKTFQQARPIVEKNEVFGFKKDLEVIKARLLEKSDNFIVIPIVGMPGTGKTTFASMLFDDLSILNNSIRIWVPVSKWCDRKHKFTSIIYQITKSTEDLTTKSEEILKDTIQTLLKDRRYFIILDDVWEKKDWDSLQTAFPKNMNGNRVLVTTRHDNVVDSTWKSHNLGKLSDGDGWLLIKNNVFGSDGYSYKSFEAVGKVIAKKCKGLPLALVVVAGILRKCVTSADWQRVADNPLLEINREDQSYHELVKMSYNDLPHEKLKNCFLYFAYFPMGHEIDIWKLVCLWIAEGFIPTINEWEYRIDAEVEAQKYLNDLVDRNLLTVIKRRADGQIKTCRIHDTLHEFCKSEAGRKNLFLVMDKEQMLDENTCSARRLCFHSFTADKSDDKNISSRFFLNWNDQMTSSSPFGKHIHSLFLSSPQKSEIPLAQDQLATIPNTFPLLRVLNIEYIKFNDSSLPKEVYRLYLLKYIAISGNLNLLPKSFKNLVELETLVIKTTARTLQIEGGIWNMEKLKHVCTNTSVQLPFPPKTNSGGKNIRTLSTISPTSCTKEMFSRTPTLQKLGVRGNLSEFLEERDLPEFLEEKKVSKFLEERDLPEFIDESTFLEFGEERDLSELVEERPVEEKQNIWLFNNLQMLKCLENLKLYGQYDKVFSVPKMDKFGCRLKKLSFSGTLFEWKDMRVLGLLEELEVLKLDDYAFKGEHWELCNDVIFKQLQYLRIGRTNLITWKVTSENSFPTLRSLVLQNCNVIERVPEAFANVPTLKVMELFHVSETAVNSAKQLRGKLKIGGFQLIITSLPTQPQREGAMTAAMDIVVAQGLSMAVNRLVDGVAEWSSEEDGLDSGLEDLVFDIEMFNARLVEAYNNPYASVDVLIVKNFQTVVDEAKDAFNNYCDLREEHEDKAFTNFLVPWYRREVKSCETEIQSVKTKMKKIYQEHEKELETLTNYKNNVLLAPQIKRPIVFDKVIVGGVKQAVNKLLQTVEENYNQSEVKDMTSHIKTFTEKLVEACKNPKANEDRVLRSILIKFGTLVNEANDAVSNYYALEKNRGENGWAKSLDKILFRGKLNMYTSEIQSISAKVKTIGKDHGKDLTYLLEYKPPPDKAENKIVGFNDDLKIIKAQLVKASEDFFVIPIVGNAGTGKTAFALKVFEDLEIRKYFTHCVWIHVSRHFHRKQKFIDILHQISKQTEDFSTALEDVLEAKIKELLEDERYLIVLDGVQRKEDWDSLKDAFPKNLKGSRVLVTTRSSNAVDSTWKSHSLRKLSNDDGWLLIKNNVFGTEGSCDTVFEEIGKKIAKKCNGLPHALVLLTGILRNCITSVAGWQRVADNPLLDINGEGQSYHELVQLSYNDLGDEKLKNCFLYFAFFPMGHEIAAWKLIHMWMAEDFIPTKDEWGYPLDKEVGASNYLNLLVDRNLVVVKNRSADGQIKTCGIHDTLHAFCKSEAERTKLFHVVDEGKILNAGLFLNRLCSYYYCHSSHSFFNFLNKRKGDQLQHADQFVKSLLLSSQKSDEINSVPVPQLINILKTMKYLKVLNIEALKFDSLPVELYSEDTIRYLAVTVDLDSLPKAFEHLSYLETLVIKTTKGTLHINGGIWNMENLRYVHTNTSTQLPSPPKTANSKHSHKQTDIRTLSTISPGSCTSDIFNMTPKLQKLGVRGNLSQLLDKTQKGCLFNNLQMLECLENLKLHGNSEEALNVPILDKFPRRLRKLTLSGTLFQWNDMTILGSLEQLGVLKLDDNAFSGDFWDLSSDVIFKGLKYLRIGKTNLVTWTAMESKKSFPVLEVLVLRNCISLENIPQDFANLDSLKVMELFDVSQKVTDFAREICEQRHGKTNVKINGFNIFTTPLPSQAMVHYQGYGDENVNTNGFDHPSTSTLSQEIVLSQAYGDENANTSISSQRIVRNQAYENENVNIDGFDHPGTSIPSQVIVHKQSHEVENVSTSECGNPSTSTPSQEIVSDDD